MKLLIIRHGEPDYEHDTLTAKGWREAELLAARMAEVPVTDFYVSPLGRAQDTAAPTLRALGRTAETLDWLREFPPVLRDRPDAVGRASCAWDWLPADWTAYPDFYSAERWAGHPVMQRAGVGEAYRRVTDAFDALLAAHGYLREGKLYRAVKSNTDTLCFFCHFGLEGVLLSHLMSVSPMILWQSACALPSSVTTVATEERREGTAAFRILGFGDTGHLYAGGEEPSFAARFCECYADADRRRD